MKHFKNGADVVVVEEVADFRVGDTHTVDYVDRYGRVWLDCGGWLQAKRLRLVEQDDPLPPAPESAMYVNEWCWAVGVRNLGDVVRIGTGNPNSCNQGWTYATLDPDAALQLAHDLNRMANEIKRRERVQSGE